MRKLAITILFMGFFLGCTAQSPVIPLTGDIRPRVENAYYKDTEGDLQELVGTWKYANGNEIFEIIIRKKVQEPTYINYKGISFYEDVLYAEYRYVDENGAELVNTLGQIDDPGLDITEHLIWGNFILTAPTNPPACDDCMPNEHRVQLTFEDPQRAYLDPEVILRVLPDTFDQYQEERLELVLDPGAGINIIPQGVPIEERIPYGTYILEKQ